MAKVTLKGLECSTNGELPQVDAQAPDFNLTNNKLEDLNLNNWQGKKKLLNIVPSLDTEICAKSTKRFNELAQDYSDIVMLIISSDLPFAQNRFCHTENLENVYTLSMMRSRKFAKDYGVLLENGPLAGIMARAVLVLDESNKVIHSQLVKDITQEPDYDSAIAALRS